MLRLFHGDSRFVRIREMFELGGVELERVHCMDNLRKLFVSGPWPDSFFFFQSEAPGILTYSPRLWSYILRLTITTGKSCVSLNSVQEFIEEEARLLWPFFAYAYTSNSVLYVPLSHIKDYRCLKKLIHRIYKKNERLLLSATSMAKFELALALTLENVLS